MTTALPPLAVLVCTVASVAAQTTWINVSPAVNPPRSSTPKMTYDSVRSRAVLFAEGTTWEWDGVGWSPRNTPVAPPARDAAAFAFDASRGRAVLFGGAGRNDTWEWDGTTWAQRFPPTSPSPRGGACVAYHAASQRLVLIGGDGTRDVWSWNGTNWTMLGLAPRTVDGAACAYDPLRAVVVVDGGGSNPFETLEWDGSVWRPVANTGPLGRGSHALAFDPFRRTLVMAQIQGGAEFVVWEWAGSSWTTLAPRAVPPARGDYVMTTDEARSQILLFGGHQLVDTWTFATDCRRVGAGHASGSDPLVCQTPPLIGQRLCFNFASPQGFGLLILGPSPCDTPFAAVGTPLFCSAGSLFPEPALFLTSTLDPALVCLDIPFDPAYVGLRACLQGASLQTGGCLRLTDAGETQIRLR